MTHHQSRLLAILVSMAIAGFVSQTLSLPAVPKALLVGLLAAVVFAGVSSATSRNRMA
jgi:hypothetical protein